MITEKRRARVAFRCQKKLLNTIRDEAAKRKLTMSALIVEVLSESLLPPPPESVRQNYFCGNPNDLLDQISFHLGQAESKSNG
jgi:hypothetical protein